MMRWLRGQVAKVIFGVLLVAFVGWIFLELGMKGKVGGPTGSVAEVNGERVSAQEFWLSYNQEVERTWETMRGSLTEADERELRKTVLNGLIDQTLIWQEAKRLGYAVSEKEVEEAIRTLPAFLNEQRQFDPLRYQAALNRLGIPQRLFEKQQERAMSSARLLAFNRDSIRVTDLELWLEYLRWHRRVKVLLLKFPLAEARKRIKVTSAEIKEYWTQRRREFEKEEKVRLRHIVVAANPQAGPEAAAQARAKMEAIVTEIKGGADFAEVARRQSDDANTKQRGGDLGWRVKGELIPEYDERVFKLKTGGMTEVFQTQFGYHLIKCDEHQKEEKPAFSQVREKIRTKLVTSRARRDLVPKATRAAWHLQKEKDLRRVAELVKRPAVQTGWFERGGEAPTGLTKETAEALTRALAALEVGDVTGLIATDQGYFLAQLTDEQHKRAPEADFLKEREEIEPVLVERKRRAVYESWLGKLREKADIERHLEGI